MFFFCGWGKGGGDYDRLLRVQRSLLKTIRKRQMEFLGHVCRRRGLEFLSLTGKVEGKRDRGKQRITFLDSLCNSATGGQSKGLNFLKLSDDRDVWRGMVANVCSRSGTWWWWWLRDEIIESCLTEQRCSVNLSCVTFRFVLLLVRPLCCWHGGYR